MTPRAPLLALAAGSMLATPMAQAAPAPSRNDLPFAANPLTANSLCFFKVLPNENRARCADTEYRKFCYPATFATPEGTTVLRLRCQWVKDHPMLGQQRD